MPDRKLGKRILSSKFLLIISLLVLIFFTVNLSKEIVNRRDLQAEIHGLQAKIDSLKSHNQELTSLIEYYKTIDFVENEARTKLNLRKPGEKIIIVPPPDEQNQNSEKVINEPIFTTTAIKDLSNIQRWWNYFFEIE